MFKAIIFDVDGTLSETEELHREAFNRAFEHQDLGWNWSRSDYRELLNTTGGKERIRRFMQDHDPDRLRSTDNNDFIPKLHKIKTAYYTQLIAKQQAELRPGIRELIQASADNNLRLAIATTTSLPNVEALLKAAYGDRGATLFEVISCGDSVVHKKPAPDIYEQALTRLNLEGQECIAIEDSRNGLLSAVAAGIPTIITPGFYTEDQNFAEAKLITSAITFESIETVYRTMA